MPREYVSLDVAARILGISADELKKKYQKHEIRGYQDRGTFQFDKGYIMELARQMGGGSEPEVQVDSGLRPRAADSPPPKPAKEEDTDEQVEIGQEMVVEDRKSGSKSGAKSGAAAKAAGDSDVRLVVEGGEFDLQIAQDSDVKVMDDAGPAATSKSPSKRKTITPPPDGPDDSGVRLVPMPQEADSDVRIDVADVPSLPDSDINKMAQLAESGTGGVESLLTEEIDLDAEIRKRQQAEAEKSQAKLKPKTKAPEAAPFELSAEDLKGPPPTKPKSGVAPPKSGVSASKSGVAPPKSGVSAPKSGVSAPKSGVAPPKSGVSPPKSGVSPPRSGVVAKTPPPSKEEEVELGELQKRDLAGPSSDSGINLEEPADSGISLEKSEGTDEIEFELSLDDVKATPRPITPKPAVPRSGAKKAATPKPKTEEPADSSEFELTLDDSGQLAPLEEDAAGDKDIFETDFELPALEESSSEAVPIEDSDTDLESSDFDLALTEEEVAAEEESGSQVVALEDEDAEEGAATVAKQRGRHAAAAGVEVEEAGDLDELLGEEEVGEGEAEVEEEELEPAAVAAPADWGILPAAVMIPCVLIMFFVGLMSFELLHSMWGYQKPSGASGGITRSIAEIFGEKTN